MHALSKLGVAEFQANLVQFRKIDRWQQNLEDFFKTDSNHFV